MASSFVLTRWRAIPIVADALALAQIGDGFRDFLNEVCATAVVAALKCTSA